MSCTVGLKRKLKPDDEDEAGREPKVPSVLEEPQLAYSVQRQALMQLSLQKLCGHVETALVRRVLITNMLRYIQQELSQQGALIVTESEAPEVGQVKGASSEGSLTPAWVLEQDGELLFSLHSSVPAHSASSRPSEKDSFSTALAEIEDLCPTLFASSPSFPTFSCAATSSSAPPVEPQWSPNKNGRPSFLATEPSERQTEIHTGSSGTCDSAYSSGPICLPELSMDDFLFSDIDNFLCELNSCGLNPSPSPAQGSSSSSKVVSMVTDDLVKSLTNQPFKTDLNELDHIMEVLVSS